MARSKYQFQKGLSLRQYLRLYGTEEGCEAVLENARWSDGSAAHAIAAWARDHLAPGSAVLSDSLAWFGSITAASYNHEVIVTGGKHPNDLPLFRWINIVLGNLKTNFGGTIHAFNINKYAR